MPYVGEAGRSVVKIAATSKDTSAESRSLKDREGFGYRLILLDSSETRSWYVLKVQGSYVSAEKRDFVCIENIII